MPGGSSNLTEGRKTTKENANANRPLTRHKTRRTGTVITSLSTSENICDVVGARSYLKERLLLCPLGEPASHASLSSCLHQVSKMSGIGSSVASAVCSVTLHPEKLKETAINKTVRDTVISQLNELTLNKTLITDIKDKIDTHMQKFSTGAQTGTATLQPSYGTRTYAEALVNPPSHANPRLAAREAIRARQFMLEGLDK